MTPFKSERQIIAEIKEQEMATSEEYDDVRANLYPTEVPTREDNRLSGIASIINDTSGCISST